jgi:sugar phosphate isomerase/epimerase
MHDPNPAKHEEQMADCRRFVDLAERLQAPYVRVMGNQVAGTPQETIARIAESLRRLGDYAGPKKVTVLLESHGDFTRSAELLEILQRADSPHVAILWDTHNSFVVGKEEPGVTVARLGKYIRHTHFKDSISQNGEDHYVLTKRGTVPIKQQVDLLIDIGYEGCFSYEWEKAWHPDIDEPEVAFPDYAKVMTGYLNDGYFRRRKGRGERAGA